MGWQELGQTLSERLRQVGSQTNIWVNTDGRSVHWLHVRLDSRPKYYRHSPYADPDYGTTFVEDDESLEMLRDGRRAVIAGCDRGAGSGSRHRRRRSRDWPRVRSLLPN